MRRGDAARAVHVVMYNRTPAEPARTRVPTQLPLVELPETRARPSQASLTNCQLIPISAPYPPGAPSPKTMCSLDASRAATPSTHALMGHLHRVSQGTNRPDREWQIDRAPPHAPRQRARCTQHSAKCTATGDSQACARFVARPHREIARALSKWRLRAATAASCDPAASQSAAALTLRPSLATTVA